MTLPRMICVALMVVAVAATARGAGAQTLLNVSYDPTRELYQDFNAAFIRSWQAKSGKTVVVKQSHGGSGAQARASDEGASIRAELGREQFERLAIRPADRVYVTPRNVRVWLE